MSVGPVGGKTLKDARDKQKELKATQGHHPMVNAIANMEAPLCGGGPSLECNATQRLLQLRHERQLFLPMA